MPRPSALGAAGAVVGLLGQQVVLDVVVGEGAHRTRHAASSQVVDARGAQRRPPRSGTRRCARAWRAAAPRRRRGARLAERLAIEVGHLVGADDHRAGVVGGHVARLGAGQAAGQRGGLLRRVAAVSSTSGRDGLEGQAQPFEQLAAIARGGREDQPMGRIHPPILPLVAGCPPCWRQGAIYTVDHEIA
jgi:hypothetical protein